MNPQTSGNSKTKVFLVASLLVLRALTLSGTTRYVDINNPFPVWPYTNWTMAANVIQDAVDAAQPLDLIVVNNGVYRTGGRPAPLYSVLTNRVLFSKSLTIQSVNGPAETFIEGYQVPGTTTGRSAVRCVYMGGGSRLIGFTLTNGATYSDSVMYSWGGGALCQGQGIVVSNCVFINNSAGERGGAAFNSPGLVVSNRAVKLGGGTLPGDGGETRNCTLVGNTALTGGGAAFDFLNSCILYYNTAQTGANYSADCLLNHCCTEPMPVRDLYMNFTNPPLFTAPDLGDFTLQANSPCINAGDNAYTKQEPDLAGNPRFAGGTVDVGAYEYQNPRSIISYFWLQQYGFPTDGSVDYIDSDGDGMDNWQEWRCSTDPTDPGSALRILSVTKDATGVLITWQGVDRRSYSLYRASDLSVPHSLLRVSTNLVSWRGIGAHRDPGAESASFYRLSVNDFPSP